MKKKARNFGPPCFGAPPSGLHPSGPHFFQVWAPMRGFHPSRPQVRGPKPRPPHSWSTTGPHDNSTHTEKKPDQLISISNNSKNYPKSYIRLKPCGFGQSQFWPMFFWVVGRTLRPTRGPTLRGPNPAGPQTFPWSRVAWVWRGRRKKLLSLKFSFQTKTELYDRKL